MFDACSRIIDALMTDASGEGIWQKPIPTCAQRSSALNIRCTTSPRMLNRKRTCTACSSSRRLKPRRPLFTFLADSGGPGSLQTLSYGAVRRRPTLLRTSCSSTSCCRGWWRCTFTGAGGRWWLPLASSPQVALMCPGPAPAPGAQTGHTQPLRLPGRRHTNRLVTG